MKHILYLLIFSFSWVNTYSQPTYAEVSHYVFPEFAQGVVLMKTGMKHTAMLNYNSLTEEMIFENKDKKMALAADELEQVDTVFISDRKFFTLNNRFLELVYHATADLYAENKCKLNIPGKPSAYGGTSQTSASSSASSFYSGGDFYILKLPGNYEVKPYIHYWLKKNGELKRFINMRQLMNLYDNKKGLFKAYVKKHNIKYDNQESLVQLIGYLEAK